MCAVLRCCGDDGSQAMFDLDEINISSLYRKPTAIVDGQPVRFARVQPLGDSSALSGNTSSWSAASEAEAAESGSRGVMGTAEHRQQELGLDRLKLSSPPVALPSAEEVWSPIIALRTFVEPLTSRASAAFRNLHISFHDPEGGGEAAGGGGNGGGAVVATTTGVVLAGTAAQASTATGNREEKEEMEEKEERGGSSTAAAVDDGAERREERSAQPGAKGAPPACAAAAAAAACAPEEELRKGSGAGRFWHQGSGGIELSMVSIGHDRAGGGEGETAEDVVETKDDDDGYGSRVAV